MKKEYLSPDFDFRRILLAENICISAEDPNKDIHEEDDNDDV